MRGIISSISKRLGEIAGHLAVIWGMRPCIYYYVPPCPECGSHITGRYVRRPLTKADIRYVKNESLSHGEIIRMADKVPVVNAFCETCGHEWPEHVFARIVPGWMVEEEKTKRGTRARYAEFQTKEPRRRPFWSRFTGFFY